MTYTGIYKDENKNMRSCRTEHNTKKDVERDIRGNGYTVVTILNDNEIEAIKDRDHADHSKVCDRQTSGNKWRNDICDYVRQCL